MRSILLVLIFVPLIAAASPLPDYPFVYASGVAHREVAPDKATISFRVKSYDVQAEQAYKKQSEIADAVIAFSEKLGVPSIDIVADAIEKTVVRKEDDKGKELDIIGYDAVRKVRIELKDLNRFPQLIDFLYSQSNIEQISVVFGSKDEEAILQSLTSDACKSARESAGRMAAGFQKKLGAVRAVSENGFSGIGSRFGLPGEEVGYYAAAAIGEKRDFRVIPSTISFGKAINVIFSIE